MSEPLRVLICGSRGWTDRERIKALMTLLPYKTIIAHGDASGADRMAGSVAIEFGLPVKTYPADWRHHGKAAGPIRNKQMLDDFKPEVVVAFYLTPITPGTADMIARARSAGIPVLGISNL